MARTLSKGLEETRDVSLRELEAVPPPLPKANSAPSKRTNWLSIDRIFLSSFTGLCLLMLGAFVMVLWSMRSVEAPQVEAPKQAQVPAADPAADPVALNPVPNPQVEAVKEQPLRAKRKVRKQAARVSTKAKVATRKAKQKRGSLASR